MKDIKFLRISQVEQLTGIKKTSIYKRMKDGTFPPSKNIGSRAVAWTNDSIQSWMENPTAQASSSPKTNSKEYPIRKLKVFENYDLTTLSDYWLCLASEFESALIQGGANTSDYKVLDLFIGTQAIVSQAFYIREESLSFVSSYPATLVPPTGIERLNSAAAEGGRLE